MGRDELRFLTLDLFEFKGCVMKQVDRAFTAGSLEVVKAAYPAQSAKLAHNITNHALFELEALAGLARRLDPSRVEYNHGDLPLGQDPNATPGNGLSIVETIRSIEENGSWLVLKNVENDPAYATLLDSCLAELEPVIKPATGPYLMREAFIFVSSPNSITPFHIDPEHNILLQIRGEKLMRVFPRGDEIAPPEVQETFHSVGGHRNLKYDPAFERLGQDFALAPGDGVLVPPKAPHWVRNGEKVSISFSITWRSRLSDNDERVYRINRRLRRIGLKPVPPGKSQARDLFKALTHRAIGKAASKIGRQFN